METLHSDCIFKTFMSRKSPTDFFPRYLYSVLLIVEQSQFCAFLQTATQQTRGVYPMLV